jgi:hypothetical protein
MRVEERAKEIADKLDVLSKYLVDSYVTAMTTDIGYNKDLFDIVNKDWQSYVHKVNRTQKLIYANPFGFRDMLAMRLSELSKVNK